MEGIILQEEIDESGAGDCYFRDGFVCGQCPYQGFGELTRILPRGFSEAHGQIAREVAVLRITSAFNFDADPAGIAGHKVFR